MNPNDMLMVAAAGAFFDMVIIASYIVLSAMLFGVSVYEKSRLADFLKEHQAITDASALEQFKDIVRHNMIAALTTLVAGVLQILLGLFMMSRTVIIGLFLVLCINIPMFFYGRSIKKLELQSRELPCSDPLLRGRYESAIMTWKKKMFPAF